MKFKYIIARGVIKKFVDCLYKILNISYPSYVEAIYHIRA